MRIEYILNNSSIERFIGFDISHTACEEAWVRLSERIPPRQLTLISGDALHNTAELHGYVRELSRSPDDIVLISVHGVLHEIIQEHVTELQSFMASLCQRYPRVLLYVREPCEPINLPANVVLEFGGLSSAMLKSFGELVAVKLNLPKEISETAPNAIMCSRNLASEIAVKLFYIEDFDYEIQERITAINPTDFSSLILSIDPSFRIDQSMLNLEQLSEKIL
jgi:hypothetical protein